MEKKFTEKYYLIVSFIQDEEHVEIFHFIFNVNHCKAKPNSMVFFR